MAGDEPIIAEEELALADDERLPWLESDDDYEEPAVDTGRIVAFAGGSLLVLALIVGGIWWATTRDAPSGEAVADGSVIEAPDEPYRTRPDDPGGREVAGTGDTSFEVAEGRQVEGRIAAPPATAPATPASKIVEDGGASASAGASSGVGVQVGAYSTRAAAEAGWSTLANRIGPLQGRGHRIVEATIDSGRIFRLQALAGSAGEAETLCREIKAAGGDCQVKR